MLFTLGQDAGVVIGFGQRDQKGLFLFLEEIDGSFAGGAMEAAIGHLVSPGEGLVVEVGQGGEGSAGEEIVFDIAYDVFRRVLFHGGF